MSTFLEIVQELHEEVGASGAPPSTVLNQRGEAQRLVNWVKRADELIQNLWINWKFLRGEYSESTTAGVVQVPSVQGASYWDEDSFKIFEPGSTIPFILEVAEYDEIKSEVRDASSAMPFRLIIMPDNTLEAEATPDAAYPITGDYYSEPTLLANDADISAIPPQFHRAILGRAMILYGNFENAPEMKTQGQEVYSEVLTRLQNKQLPNKHQAQFRTGGNFEVIGSQ